MLERERNKGKSQPPSNNAKQLKSELKPTGSDWISDWIV